MDRQFDLVKNVFNDDDDDYRKCCKQKLSWPINKVNVSLQNGFLNKLEKISLLIGCQESPSTNPNKYINLSNQSCHEQVLHCELTSGFVDEMIRWRLVVISKCLALARFVIVFFSNTNQLNGFDGKTNIRAFSKCNDHE